MEPLRPLRSLLPTRAKSQFDKDAPEEEENSDESARTNKPPPDASAPGGVMSDAIKSLIEDIEVKGAVGQISGGAFMLKYCNNVFRRPHSRLFWVDMEVLALKWTSPTKGAARTQIFLTDVDRIVPGQDSDYWQNKPPDDKALGIELLSSTRNLRFVCNNNAEWKVWLRGLLYAHHKAITKRKRAASLTNDFIRKQWELADIDGSESIQFNELVHILQSMNCRVDIRYAEQLMNQFDVDGSRVLMYDEFKTLIFTLLTHQDLIYYFDTYKTGTTMTDDGIQLFLHEVQATPPTQITEALHSVAGLKEPFVKDGNLTDLGFNLIMTSDYNSIFNPQRARVYQDMSQPISHYWIASSHNTYLTGDQIVGKSAVSRYIDVLLRGCRCVELDCWDGADGDPVIYHGRTMTSRILFQSVVQAISDYAFQNSPYPVVLSLEMHCSPRQKSRVGQIMGEILGSRIYRHRPGDPPPSPKTLMGCFLVKAKVPRGSGDDELEEGNEDDIRRDEEELEYSLSETGGPPQPIANKPEAKGGLEKYYDLVALRGNRAKSFTDASNRTGMDICSFNEWRFSKFLKANPMAATEFHQKHLTRVYPSGTRVMSSNFNPIFCWASGVQIVAMNYQGMGLAMLVNEGRFAENGNCGYVLKPPVIRTLAFDPFDVDLQTLKAASEAPMELTIDVLAGQQFPRPSADTRKASRRKADVACPYVIVSMQGLKSDCETKKTPPVMNNGLNPRWTGASFTFNVTVPSLSILVFEVRHYDPVKTDFLAAAAFPVSAIRTGIRWVPLVDAKFRKISWSGLLAHIKIRPSKRFDAQPLPVTGQRAARPVVQQPQVAAPAVA